MAVHNSVELGLISQGRIDMVDVGCFSGNLHFQQATVLWQGQPLNDVINLFTIPRGGRVIMMWTNTTESTATPIRIGDFQNNQKFRTSSNLSATAQSRLLFPTASTLAEGIYLPYQQETTIFLHVSGAALTTTGSAVFTCMYTFD